MTVDGIGPIEHLPRNIRSAKSESVEQPTAHDAVDFSPEARGRAEFEKALEEVKNVPNIRADVVAEAKRKLADPNYLSNQSGEQPFDVIADRIIDMLGI